LGGFEITVRINKLLQAQQQQPKPEPLEQVELPDFLEQALQRALEKNHE
jgi:hypothetical protein